MEFWAVYGYFDYFCDPLTGFYRYGQGEITGFYGFFEHIWGRQSLLLQAKLHQDNALLMHKLIATIKANAEEMIGKMIYNILCQSSSGRDG